MRELQSLRLVQQQLFLSAYLRTITDTDIQPLPVVGKKVSHRVRSFMMMISGLSARQIQGSQQGQGLFVFRCVAPQRCRV